MSESIPKKPDPSAPSRFDRLRREGIDAVQELSGRLWTDYNLHDPGVTILEQLCYALTESIYRSEFPVEDWLTRDDGTIDFDRQALYPPQRIFPSRPITVMDYRKAILDSVPEIDNVWLQPIENESDAGLYRMLIKVGADVDADRRDAIAAAARRMYLGSRNLCEDLDAVIVLDPIECRLIAEIDITGARDPNHIAADIYHRCALALAKHVTVHSHEACANRGMSFEHLFDGPPMQHGVLDERDLVETAEGCATVGSEDVDVDDVVALLTTHMFAIVTAIEGVHHIRTIALDVDRSAMARLRGTVNPELAMHLAVPTEQARSTVTLIKHGRALPLSLHKMRMRYDELQFQYRSARFAVDDLDRVVALPAGQVRSFLDYTSIQHQFPTVYGISACGVPDSAAADVKARALQLRTYLLLFEQLLANYAANLHAARTLFSLDDEPRQSYWYRALTDATIPGIERVYTRTPTAILHELITSGYDACNYHERKSRLLDYLLALYGEKFSQFSLRHFNVYYADEDIDEVILRNKRELLQSLVEMSQHRTSGFCYQEAAWNTGNVAMLKKKVSLLLGVRYWDTRSFTDVFIEHGLELVTDEQAFRIQEGVGALEYVDVDDIDARTVSPFETPPPDISAGKRAQHLFRDILFLKHNIVSESILRHGIDLNRYRVGSTGRSGLYQIAFHPHDRGQWMYLASYPTKEEAMGTVNDLRALLTALNRESEGLHLVEHILLRPHRSDPSGIAPRDFYAFRISVIFPRWTARFHNREFRMLAEETVRLNCPAHIVPQCYWLDFEAMEAFELLYKAWLHYRCAEHPRIQELDMAARQLTEFLLDLPVANTSSL